MLNNQNSYVHRVKSAWILQSGFLLILGWFPGFCDAPNGVPFTRIDSITEMMKLDSNWLYHKGNNPEWALVAYDDSGWDTLSTRLNLDQMDNDLFEEIGWFRLHLRIDSTLFNQAFALTIDQMGVSEIYFNGKKIETIGSFANDTSEERRFNPRLIPYLIQFNTQKNQLLALKYAHKKARQFSRRFDHKEMGFTVSIKPMRIALEEVKYFIFSNYGLLALMMVFLILGLIHILIFLFYRKKIANLYFGIFMLIFSAIVYVARMEVAITINPDIFIKARFFMSLGLPLFFISLVGFIYSLFYEKIPFFFWIILAIGVILILGYAFGLSFQSYILFGYAILVPLEVIRVLIRAILKRMEGAWIIGSGVILFIIFLLIILLLAVINENIVLNSSNPFQFLLLILILLAILSIPLSMSFYLAWDIARTNVNLEKQLIQVRLLSAKSLEQEREKKRILEGQKEMLEQQVAERTKELQLEKEKTEELLLNTLPLKVVNDLKENGKTEPESFDEVTVFFSDIVGFTNLSAQLNPDLLIKELNLIFTAFDDIMTNNHCERIKTIGDAYLAVCGMPEKNEHHAENMIRAAIEIRNYIENRNSLSDIQWKIRIGIHSGKVIGGIVGIRKYIYDVFGDTINTTSRMESNSKPMGINVSESTYHLVKEKFQFTPRKPIEIKGKGVMKMYFLK
jgi:adenylate cyclase